MASGEEGKTGLRLARQDELKDPLHISCGRGARLLSAGRGRGSGVLVYNPRARGLEGADGKSADGLGAGVL